MVRNCFGNEECDIKAKCEQYPDACENVKEAMNLKKEVFYYGTYDAPNGQTYSIPVYIDLINNHPEVSLEGSKQTRQITISNGVFEEMITMEPYSVVLLEISE